MRLLITASDGSSFPVDVAEEMELENLLALCQAEMRSLSGLTLDKLLALHNGRPLVDRARSLKDLGIAENDIILISAKKPSRQHNPSTATSGPLSMMDFSQIQVPGTNSASATRRPTPLQEASEDPAHVRDMILRDPALLATLRQNNPPLAEALESGNFQRFSEMLREQVDRRRQAEMKRIRMMNADEMDIDAQNYIEENIMRENLESNLETAMEHNPEIFGVVSMLYIRCKVNGREIKAFVDSGAQSTIMSAGCAERCNITRLLDRRFTGIAKGVGTQKIIGRIHLAQLQIEEAYLPTSFTVLEDQSMDMLLGLDMLRRHQCCIDLRENVLVIGTTGTKTPFLPESELPAHAKLNGVGEEAELAKALEDSAQDQGEASTSGATGISGDAQKLVEMGFERSAVVKALELAKGDTNTALAMLLAQSLPKPPSVK